jgi:endonuclease I
MSLNSLSEGKSRFPKMKTIPLLALLFFLITTVVADIPPGYYDPAAGLTGTDLQLALHNIIKNHNAVSYTPGVWNAFYTTDDKPNGTVWDMYSDIPNGSPNGNPPYVYYFGSDQCGTASQEGDCYSREHSFPASWFNYGSPMYTDLFHIVPADLYVNQVHSNYPYGNVTNPTWTSLNGSKVGPCSTAGYTGTVFEPRDEYKGDFARNYFYMAVRYYTEDSSWPGSPMVDGSQPKSWALAMLMLWHTQDPVSQKEIDRNNAIYAIQNNRNPFIDHPEYVDGIWNPNSGVNPEPTQHVTSFSSHSVHLQWIDATGTMLPDGYLVRMSSTGYDAIPVPVDGVVVPNGTTDKNVLYGVEDVWFDNLTPNTTYYFKVYGYTYTASGIDFKTDGTILQTKQNTQP